MAEPRRDEVSPSSRTVLDAVDQTLADSFPASDPPPWWGAGGTATDPSPTADDSRRTQMEDGADG